MSVDSNNKKLFAEFPEVDTQAWEAVIEKDLKGARREKLVWKLPEGIQLEPYYRSENVADKEYLQSNPAEFPYIRGNKATDNDWLIRQDIFVDDVKKANTKALNVLMKGVNSLGFIIEDGRELTREEFDRLFENIWANSIEVNFIAGYNNTKYVQYLEELTHKRNRNAENINGSIDFDPLIYLSLHGNFPESEQASFKLIRQFIDDARRLPKFRILSVNGQFFKEAGANIVQELAFSLAAGNEYLSKLTDKALTIDEIAPKMQFNFGVSSNYFLEIAKLRAARMLWARIVKAYKPSSDKITQMHVHSVTADINKTIYDPYVNMLRTTTEAMSAVLGGTNSLCVKGFDSVYKNTDEFSERIARNQQILLKEESYLGKIVDPGAGSYYIENLSHSIAEHAWKLFLEVEEAGGYLEALKKGIIQNKIEESANHKRMNVATRKEIFLGTNQYPSVREKVSDKTNKKPIEYKQANELIVKPIKPFRLAEGFEALRLRTEKSSKTPRVFLFTYGNLAMRKARATFALNFFACAGFEVEDNAGFKTMEEGIEAAQNSKADIIVICSSDKEYASIAKNIYQQLHNQAIIVVAGYPKDIIEDLKGAGIEHFIHVKSNILEELNKFQNSVLK